MVTHDVRIFLSDGSDGWGFGWVRWVRVGSGGERLADLESILVLHFAPLPCLEGIVAFSVRQAFVLIEQSPEKALIALNEVLRRQKDGGKDALVIEKQYLDMILDGNEEAHTIYDCMEKEEQHTAPSHHVK